MMADTRNRGVNAAGTYKGSAIGGGASDRLRNVAFAWNAGGRKG